MKKILSEENILALFYCFNTLASICYRASVQLLVL